MWVLVCANCGIEAFWLQLLKYSSSEGETQLVYLASGASAELMTNVLFVPTEVVKCRLQLGTNPHRATGGVVPRSVNYHGAVDAVTTIVREEVRSQWLVSPLWDTYMCHDVLCRVLGGFGLVGRRLCCKTVCPQQYSSLRMKISNELCDMYRGEKPIQLSLLYVAGLRVD